MGYIYLLNNSKAAQTNRPPVESVCMLPFLVADNDI